MFIVKNRSKIKYTYSMCISCVHSRAKEGTVFDFGNIACDGNNLSNTGSFRQKGGSAYDF